MKYCCGKGIDHRPTVTCRGEIVWLCRDHRDKKNNNRGEN